MAYECLVPVKDSESTILAFLNKYKWYFIGGGAALLVILIGSIVGCVCSAKKKKQKGLDKKSKKGKKS